MSPKTKLKPAVRPVIESLESRLLYSVDPFGLSLDADTETGQPEPGTFDLPVAQSSLMPQVSKIIFVDENVKNHQLLTQQLSVIHGEHSATRILTIGATQTLDDIGLMLSNHTNLDSIEFITHGSDNSIRIGDDVLGSGTIVDFQAQLTLWGQSLSSHGDLLFYGCNIAETEAGKQLIQEIADVTGADVAASTDLTGHHTLGGDWDLEHKIGDVLADSPLLAKQLDHWESVLAPIEVSTSADIVDAADLSSIAALIANPGTDNAISLREAIAAANNDPGIDTIDLPAGTYSLTEGELVITDDDVVISGLNRNAEDTIIDTNNPDRALNFNNSNSAVKNITIQNGDTASDGGAILATNSDIDLQNVILNNNQSSESGGAIYADSTSEITISDSTITNNIATVDGGAIFNEGKLSTYRTEIAVNQGDVGGAIFSSGDLLVVDTWLHNNEALDAGGAIHNDNVALVKQSLLQQNTALNQGGAISSDGSSFVIENTTLTHNSATKADAGTGGAVSNLSGDMEINLSTIVHNQSYYNSAFNTYAAGNLSFQGNIIQNNDAGLDADLTANLPGTVDLNDIADDAVSRGFNLVDTNFDDELDSDQRKNDIGLEAELSAAGGFTKVYQLESNSWAINHGPANLNNSVDGTRRTSQCDL